MKLRINEQKIGDINLYECIELRINGKYYGMLFVGSHYFNGNITTKYVLFRGSYHFVLDVKTC